MQYSYFERKRKKVERFTISLVKLYNIRIVCLNKNCMNGDAILIF